MKSVLLIGINSILGVHFLLNDSYTIRYTYVRLTTYFWKREMTKKKKKLPNKLFESSRITSTESFFDPPDLN